MLAARARAGRGTLLRAVLMLAVLPLLLAATLFAGLLGADAGPVPARVPAGGDDGLWLAHAWVDGGRSTADLDALAARLRKTGIRDLSCTSARSPTTVT